MPIQTFTVVPFSVHGIVPQVHCYSNKHAKLFRRVVRDPSTNETFYQLSYHQRSPVLLFSPLRHLYVVLTVPRVTTSIIAVLLGIMTCSV